MTNDTLFSQVAAWQEGTPWGRFLDAGTGEHSLRWLTGLKTERWTAITGDPTRASSLRERFGPRMRPGDQVIAGNWTDPGLLQGQRFDVVLADYLMGAIDGFAPYFQDQLLERLRPMVGQALYIIGLEPFPDTAPHSGGRLILEIARLRDACILLAGHRCYREFPRAWMLRQLERAGFQVQQQRSVPILFGERYIRGQLGVCRRKLPLFQDRAVAREVERHIHDLERQALAHLSRHGRIPFGEDYIIRATPQGAP
jgi:hypothetical protein